MQLYQLARAMHVCAAIYNLIYVYTPLHQWDMGFSLVQYVSMPLLILSGALLVRCKQARLRE